MKKNLLNILCFILLSTALFAACSHLPDSGPKCEITLSALSENNTYIIFVHVTNAETSLEKDFYHPDYNMISEPIKPGESQKFTSTGAKKYKIGYIYTNKIYKKTASTNLTEYTPGWFNFEGFEKSF